MSSQKSIAISSSHPRTEPHVSNTANQIRDHRQTSLLILSELKRTSIPPEILRKKGLLMISGGTEVT